MYHQRQLVPLDERSKIFVHLRTLLPICFVCALPIGAFLYVLAVEKSRQTHQARLVVTEQLRDMGAQISGPDLSDIDLFSPSDKDVEHASKLLECMDAPLKVYIHDSRPWEFGPIKRTNISNLACKALGDLKGIRELSIESSAIDDEGIKQLCRITDLRKLSLIHCTINREGAESIAGFTKLEWLSFVFCDISWESVLEASAAPSLYSIEVYACFPRSEIDDITPLKRVPHASIHDDSRQQIYTW